MNFGTHFMLARSQDRFGGGMRDPQKFDLLDPKSGLFWTSPPLPSYKNPIFGPLCG